MKLPVKAFLVVVLILGAAVAQSQAEQFLSGEEIAGEAFVSWKAVVNKVSTKVTENARVKAKVDFRGRTLEGYRMRGAGTMRFVAPTNVEFRKGDGLQANGPLNYWATITSLLGDDLAMIRGVGLLDVSKNDSVEPIQAVVELKAAVDLESRE